MVVAVSAAPALAALPTASARTAFGEPSQGPAGSSFSASQDVPFGFARANCVDWFVRFDGSIESGHDGNSQGPTRSGTIQVPATASPGFHSVLSYCVTLDGATNVIAGQGTFEVPALATTTTTSTTSTTTTIATTTIATTTTAPPTTTTATTVKPTTTTAKATTTTAKGTTTTAKATTSTTIATTTTACRRPPRPRSRRARRRRRRPWPRCATSCSTSRR